MIPPLCNAHALETEFRARGYAVLAAPDVAQVANARLEDLNTLERSWDRLELDRYLKDGGRYRRRRHACYQLNGSVLTDEPARAHFQSLDYNALHGGLERWFEPIETAVSQAPCWRALLTGIGRACQRASASSEQRWFIEAHQFRIDTTDGIGRPTPEGAHRDGVDFVAVLLVDRVNIKGAETRVFEAAGPNGQRFTLTEPWSALLLDDARVIHESTPVQPVDTSLSGHRDTLVLTYRSHAFQGRDELTLGR